nr:MAG: dUTPase [Bacteriophage sp.]
MDVRNIREEVPNIKETEVLPQMYTLGLEQLNGYRQIESLPEYPLDINNPKSQVILKDFIGRVIEELTEGFESTEEVFELCQKNGWNIEMFNENECQSILNSLANANEEQADALGFFFTLLVYSNILPEDILSYNKAKNLFDVMAMGVKELVVKYPDYQNLLKFDIICEEDFFDEDGKWEQIISYTPGFHKMNELSHEAEKLYLWEVIYELNKARNFLKCRPWKQTQVMTKEIDFQESLVKAFYLYMGFLAMNGFTPLGLFGLFFKKQRLNLWRQQTNY